MQNIVFLLGAGTSIPAGIPSTSKITETVLSGDGFATSSVETYYHGEPPFAHIGWPDEWVPRLSAFLRIVNDVISRHLLDIEGEGAVVSYEDLYHFVNQLYGGDFLGFRWRDASVVQPMKEKLAASPLVTELLKDPVYSKRTTADLDSLVRKSMDYIKDVLWELLRREPDSLPYLSLLGDCLATKESGDVHLCTLNHDLVLLRHLRRLEVDFADGFEEQANGMKEWKSELLEPGSCRVHLLHLHGSILWHWYQSGDRSGHYDRLVKCEFCRVDHQRLWLRPTLLVGTDNKMADYQMAPFADMNFFFNWYLRHSESAIVSGYGFGDMGINSILWRWLNANKKRKMVVIDPMWQPFENWKDFQKEKRLVLLPRGIQQVTWPDVVKALD